MGYKKFKEKVKKHLNLKETITYAMALLTFGGAVWGMQTYLNKNYASAEEVKETQNK